MTGSLLGILPLIGLVLLRFLPWWERRGRERTGIFLALYRAAPSSMAGRIARPLLLCSGGLFVVAVIVLPLRRGLAVPLHRR